MSDVQIVQASMRNYESLIAAGLLGLLSSGCSKQATEPSRPSRANQAIYDYLGDPVVTPSNVDIAYTKDGLTRAMQTAAQATGISLARLEIDDSEFPFLIGVVCAHRDGLDSLKEEIRTMPNYSFSGGIGSGTQFVMNLVPSDAFPVQGRERIYRRMAVRERMLFDKISERQ